MRDIKFRAYDKEEECFIYSDKDYDEHWFEFNNGPLRAFGIEETAGSIDEPPDVKSRELEEPQEFIGLLDRQGKEIWEGDIIKYQTKYGGNSIYFEVVFARGSFLQTKPASSYFPDIWYDWDECEVIGDIYSNPELLEVK